MAASSSSPRGQSRRSGRFSRICARASPATSARNLSKRGSRAADTRTSGSHDDLRWADAVYKAASGFGPNGSALQAEDADATVTGDVDRVAVLVQRHVVNVRLHLLLLDRLLRLQVEEHQEAVHGTAGGQQPLAFRVELQPLDQAGELVAGELESPLALL